MKIFIDGDAFPNLLKPIVLRASERLKLPLILVSNKKVNMGASNRLTSHIVEAGADKADDFIVEMVESGDLVITADIPLADRVITKGAHAIDHRGERYTADNIKQYLTMRNMMDELRESGVVTGGPKPFTQKDAHAFANALNTFLNRHYHSDSV
ncbi:YaiI/YqxD family protein [Hydrogenimonas sp.]|uniref:YaiI/YqxD family protein n=1 Tax=Hydrogenimonas sp. TaxID=2231112 RepID=UPI002626CDE5|nr:YaiI/YqxD family protein [Hydrogenimonas sp.]